MPGGIDRTKTVITNMKTATAPLPPLRSVSSGPVGWSAYATCIQFTNRTGLCQSGSCLHPFPRCASPGNLGQQRSRGISVLAGERCKVSVSTHRQALAALLFFLRQGVVHGSAPGFRRSKDPAVAALAGGADPDEVVRILGFLEGEHRLFAQLRMERACGISRVCNCGSRI